MKKTSIVIKKYGAAQSLTIEESQMDTSLEDNEVLIEVHYSGINFADIVMRLGLYQDAPPRPFIPGYEVSGIVLNIGSQVKDIKIGDKVLAGTRFGGYTNVVKAKMSHVLKIPENYSIEQAAAIPVSFMTAYLSLFEIGRIKESDKVMIDCATGGVGSICLQMLQKVGCLTYGISSTKKKFDTITKYGAIPLLRSEFKNFSEKDFNFIINSSGSRASTKEHIDHLDLGGHLLYLGVSSMIDNGKKSYLKLLKGLITVPWFLSFSFMMNNYTISGINVLNYFDDPKWADKGFKKILDHTYLIPHIGKIYPFDQVTQAHLDLEQSKAVGKLLLKWK